MISSVFIRYLKYRLFCTLHIDSLEEVLNHLGTNPSQANYAALLRQCGNTRTLSQGKKIHAHIISTAHSHDSFLGNLLVQMYGKCGSIEDARLAFESIPIRNVFSWGLMISAYAQKGHPSEAIELFHRMQKNGDVKPDCFILASVLGACAYIGDLETGKEIHSGVLSGQFNCNLVVETAILNMYAKSGHVNEARNMFSSMPEKDIIAWNAMLAAYARAGHTNEAIDLYHRMHSEGIQPDEFSFSTAIAACSTLKTLKSVHGVVLSSGVQQDDAVSSALVNMYARCGSLKDAEEVFMGIERKSVVSWTAMIAAYAQVDEISKGLELYHRMCLEGVQPNNVTFTSVLTVCSALGEEALTDGCRIHERILLTDPQPGVILMNSLMNMYTKCGSLMKAKEVFDRIPDETRDVVSWNGMLAAYVHSGEATDALNFFGKMGTRGGIEPDEATFTSILGACARLGDVDQGRRIQSQIRSSDKELYHSPGIQIALLNMYARCANSKNIKKFVLRSSCSVVYCNSLITAHGLYGHAGQALKFFRNMQLDGVTPNTITLLSILSACGRAGYHEQGTEVFRSMKVDYGIHPGIEHYRCLIYVLARAGYLKSAKRVIESMEYEPGDTEWTSLLGGCRLHGDVKLGKIAAEKALEINPSNQAPYILLLNLNSTVRRLQEAKRQWKKDVKFLRWKFGRFKKLPPEPTWYTLGKVKNHRFVNGLNWRGGVKGKLKEQLALKKGGFSKRLSYITDDVWTGC